ncbi:MAG TPA: RagB/SusD family nutrient uptake outer membrane protein [Cytophagales bacterium]|nr:RagB/SusD family nutrient uptake outer membrane protein [Cytophagales bacterium]
MKKIIYSIVLILTVFVNQSCNEDLLDQVNPNTKTVTEFWLSETDAEQAVNSIYAAFYKPGSFARWIYFRLDLTSDEGFSNSPWIELADWTRFQYINYDFWEGNRVTWRDTYKAIWRCNQVLANVPGIEFQDAAKKERILAQAKFLRGLHYYYLAILWENVPIILEPSSPEVRPAGNTLEEVWVQVEKDLTEASQGLPAEWDAENKGRPTKGAAMAMLGKVHMQQREWQQALDAFDYLVTGEGKGFYDLEANFKDNFTHEKENNIESVFEIQYSEKNTGADNETQGANMGNNRAQFFAPRGIGWSDGQARYWAVRQFKKEMTKDNTLDPRLQHTFLYDSLEEDFGDKTYGRNWEWNDDEAWFRKYQRDYFRSNEDYFSQVNIRLIRFADVLLMYAEALNELDNTADAYQYVDRVRTRSNMNPLAIAYPEIGNNKDAFRERLKVERVLELCGESVRWADLKRWGDLESQAGVDKIKERDPDFNNFVVGKHVRLPIPRMDEANNVNLDQNPEY